MNKRVRILALMMMALAAVALVTGCGLQRLDVGPVQTDTETVELGDAETVSTQIRMGVGQLNISGGSDALMNGEFTYNVEAWRPEVEYTVNGRNGVLVVRQPEYDVETAGIPTDDIRYEWDLRLNEAVPMDLDIQLGVGESELNLGGLNLSTLNINTGVGQAVVDLTGAWNQSADVRIEGGVGEALIRLPSDVGVRLQSQTGLGNMMIDGLTSEGDYYVNDAYGQSDVTLDVSVRGGVGQLTIQAE